MGTLNQPPRTRRFLSVQTIFFAGAVILATAFFLTPELRRSAAQKRFPTGTPIEDAIKQISLPYYVSTNSENAQSTWRYLLVAKKDGLVMQFDAQRRLIKVVLYTDYK